MPCSGEAVGPKAPCKLGILLQTVFARVDDHRSKF